MLIFWLLVSVGKCVCWLLMGFCLGLLVLVNEVLVSFNGILISFEQVLEWVLWSNFELVVVGCEIEIVSGVWQQVGLIFNLDLFWSVEDICQGNCQISVSIVQLLELGGKCGVWVEVVKCGSEIVWI